MAVTVKRKRKNLSRAEKRALRRYEWSLSGYNTLLALNNAKGHQPNKPGAQNYNH